MVQVLLASEPQGWKQLLQGFRSEQLGKLLECLRMLRPGARKPTSARSAREAQRNIVDDNSDEAPQRKYLHWHRQRGRYEAKCEVGNLEIRSPYSLFLPVAAYYHSAIVELRGFIQQYFRVKPDATFEAALKDAFMKLGRAGYCCPFTFTSRRFLESRKHLRMPAVYDLETALEMRRDLLEVPTVARFNQVKKNWDKKLQDHEAQAKRHDKAHELKGYILAQQEFLCECPTVRLRKLGKQPPDVMLKVPVPGNLAARLQAGGQEVAELQKMLSGVAGRKAIMQFFRAEHVRRLALDYGGWGRMGPMNDTQKAGILGFVPIVDLAWLSCANSTWRQEVHQHLANRGSQAVVLTPRDFSMIAPLPQILYFLSEKLQGVQRMDLREMPLDVMSSSLLWATLSELHSLQLVVVHRSHASYPPIALERRFSVQVSL
ncbi:unnamed protein product [Symbiodinium natans]|uniref:Uncharacterized protein n=1 Tax=Symbiodinium natans TaxID=878477 RepID=A0A812SWZ5_9DINO|nr:unnamed protein product [Symbiodinium natans]